MVGIATLGRVCFKVLLVLFAVLLLNLIMIEKRGTLGSSSKANQEALERNKTCYSHNIWVVFRQGDLNIIH